MILKSKISAKNRVVELVISNLFPRIQQHVIPAVESTTLGALVKCLSRADLTRSNPDVFQLVAKKLNLEFGEHIPLAALFDFYHTGQQAPWVMFADPVNLRPDRDKLFMFGSDVLGLTQSEANSLCVAIQTLYQKEGWQFSALAPRHWCIRLDSHVNAEFSPLSTVIGRSIEDYMPGGETGKQWRSILNEVQMLLHDHAVNLKREQQGQLVVNSVWFWGGGSLAGLQPSTSLSATDRVWTDDAVVAAMARLANIKDYALPVDGKMLLSKLTQDASSNHLVYIDVLALNSIHGEADSWAKNLEILNNLWIEPLLSGLQQGSIETLRLFDDSGRCFTLSRKALRRWWKRKVLLTGYLRN